MVRKSGNQHADLFASVNRCYAFLFYVSCLKRAFNTCCFCRKALLPNTSRMAKKTGYYYYKPFVIPLLFIAIGFLGVIFKEVHASVDMGIRSWVYSIGVSHTYAADYLQHAPVVLVYIAGFCGIKGKHSLKDKTIILILSYIISTLMVHSLKNLLGILRPDGSTFNAFPSGHTTTAFMSAEFFLLEYREKMKQWSKIAYLSAIFTGLLRIYTNRHWLTDVVAGVGFGMLSTRLASLLFSLITNASRRPSRISNPKKLIGVG